MSIATHSFWWCIFRCCYCCTNFVFIFLLLPMMFQTSFKQSTSFGAGQTRDQFERAAHFCLLSPTTQLQYFMLDFPSLNPLFLRFHTRFFLVDYHFRIMLLKFFFRVHTKGKYFNNRHLVGFWVNVHQFGFSSFRPYNWYIWQKKSNPNKEKLYKKIGWYLNEKKKWKCEILSTC